MDGRGLHTQRFIAGKVAELQAHLEEQEALVAQVRAEKDVLLQGLDEQIWDLEAQLAAAAARTGRALGFHSPATPR